MAHYGHLPSILRMPTRHRGLFQLFGQPLFTDKRRRQDVDFNGRQSSRKIKTARGRSPSCTSAAFQRHFGVTRIFKGTSTGPYSTSRLDGANTQWAPEEQQSSEGIPVTGVVARQSGRLCCYCHLCQWDV